MPVSLNPGALISTVSQFGCHILRFLKRLFIEPTHFLPLLLERSPGSLAQERANHKFISYVSSHLLFTGCSLISEILSDHGVSAPVFEPKSFFLACTFGKMVEQWIHGWDENREVLLAYGSLLNAVWCLILKLCVGYDPKVLPYLTQMINFYWVCFPLALVHIFAYRFRDVRRRWKEIVGAVAGFSILFNALVTTNVPRSWMSLLLGPYFLIMTERVLLPGPSRLGDANAFKIKLQFTGVATYLMTCLTWDYCRSFFASGEGYRLFLGVCICVGVLSGGLILALGLWGRGSDGETSDESDEFLSNEPEAQDVEDRNPRELLYVHVFQDEDIILRPRVTF